jgi:hypothetical protein
VRGVVHRPREVDPAIHGKSWVAWARPEEPRPDLPPLVEGKGDSALQAMQNLANELERYPAGRERRLMPRPSTVIAGGGGSQEDGCGWA